MGPRLPALKPRLVAAGVVRQSHQPRLVPTWILYFIPLPSRLPIFHFCFFLASPPCPCSSPAIFYCLAFHFFCSAVPWNHAGAASHDSCACKMWAPLPRSQCGRRKGWGEGLTEHLPAHTRSPGWYLDVHSDCPLHFCFPSSKLDAFGGCPSYRRRCACWVLPWG